MIDRRSLIKHSGAAIAALSAGLTSPSLRAFAATAALPFENGERPLVKYPQKRPMIGLTSRPPQLETPFSVFNANVITPNDAAKWRDYPIPGFRPFRMHPAAVR